MNWESLLTRQYKGTTGGFEHCSNGRIICAFLTFAQMEYDFVNLESNKNNGGKQLKQPTFIHKDWGLAILMGIAPQKPIVP
jgi:hypothetical protein